MSKQEIAAAATLAALIAGPAVAAETAPEPAFVAPYYARGANTNVYGLQYLWKPTCECEWLKRHRLEPRLGVNFSYWDGRQPDNQHPSLWEFGTHGYLRHFWHSDAGFEPYVELGLGIHALTHTRINNNREFGTWFQFGSRIGLGLAFDAGRRWELQAFLEHISNASLASPNDGITLKGIELRVALP